MARGCVGSCPGRHPRLPPARIPGVRTDPSWLGGGRDVSLRLKVKYPFKLRSNSPHTCCLERSWWLIPLSPGNVQSRGTGPQYRPSMAIAIKGGRYKVPFNCVFRVPQIKPKVTLQSRAEQKPPIIRNREGGLRGWWARSKEAWLLQDCPSDRVSCGKRVIGNLKSFYFA